MYQVFIDDNLFCDSELDELAIINPVVNLEINKAGSFEFTVAPTHPMAGTIHRRKSVTSVIRDGELLFKGVCVSSSTDFYKQEKVKFEGELTYLNDSILRQHKYTNQTVLSLLTNYINEHNSQVESDRQFEVGTVTVSATDSILRYTNMQPTMKEIQEDLIDNYGGYISIRNEDNHRYIDYVNDNNIANQTIELGKNLIDYQSNIDTLKVATRVIPLGKKLDAQVVEGLDARLDIKSVNDGKDYVQSDDAIANFGIITAVVTFDDVTDANNLKTKGEKYVSEVQFEDVVIECTAFDMGYVTDRVDKFKLADKVRIISSAHGMDKEFVLSKMKINLADPGKDKFTFGKTEKNSLSARMNKGNTEIINQIMSTGNDVLDIALAQAMSMIAGADGGFVKLDIDEETKQPYRILVMDHSTYETSRNIIQINKNGIGYSVDGGRTYTSAWTIDGVFNAQKGNIGGWDIARDCLKRDIDTETQYPKSVKLNAIIESNGSILEGQKVTRGNYGNEKVENTALVSVDSGISFRHRVIGPDYILENYSALGLDGLRIGTETLNEYELSRLKRLI